MKKTFLLCALAAFLGMVAALGWREFQNVEPRTAAEEPVRPVQWSSLPAQEVRTTPTALVAATGSPVTVPTPAVRAVQWSSPPAQETRSTPAALVAPPGVPLPAPTPGDDLMPDERVSVAVYQNVNRSVVNINTKSVQTDRLFMFEIPAEGEGSGIVIDRQGHILTNYHVVNGARSIQVALWDGKSYPAKGVGKDEATDVAVLKIDAPKEALFPVVFGNSAGLLVGQRVYAIGNPFGLERTLTTGIISSLNRSLPAKGTSRLIKSIIQIDAAINPGNSGGPLLDSHGRMIGMNFSIASKTGESVGVGFAIPINTIARVVPQLIQNGKVRRPESGIARVYETDRGLLVLVLVPGGAAEKAGLQGPKETRQGPFVFRDISAADVIAAVDGQPVRTGDDFLSLIEAKQPGDQVMLTVIRGGKQGQIPLRLEAGE